MPVRRVSDQQARAIRRCGELLKQVEEAKRGPKQLSDSGGTKFGHMATAELAGLSRRQTITAIRVAAVPRERFEAQVESDGLKMGAATALGIAPWPCTPLTSLRKTCSCPSLAIQPCTLPCGECTVGYRFGLVVPLQGQVPLSAGPVQVGE